LVDGRVVEKRSLQTPPPTVPASEDDSESR